ncbi:hypothetical protein DPEC_G00213220 [Dallia pectoralis]|uniref:Uncharacterized protein n=1 Tax=Dallia pectoralis TaxID=75939 RepID=A0ACC2G6J4_DALPE|nr:hypothetical protein DPEC_G00213220 [Dallia pectoralis]
MESRPSIITRRVLLQHDGLSCPRLSREFVRWTSYYANVNVNVTPSSPCPHVPDITETSSGLEWFEMGLATSSGLTSISTDQGVPNSPYLAPSVILQSSPLSNFAVPSTPLQSRRIPDKLAEYSWLSSPELCHTQPSPIAQTVPVIETKIYPHDHPVRKESEELSRKGEILVEMRRTASTNVFDLFD